MLSLLNFSNPPASEIVNPWPSPPGCGENSHSALAKRRSSSNYFSMKAVLFAGVLLATQALVFANDPAYTALRVVGKSRGEDVLKHVIELRGKGGTPQPVTWKIVLDDPRARGGVRELEIEHGKIVSERTPISLCGRNAVQVHEQKRNVDLAELGRRLEPLGTVRVNEFAMRAQLPPYELTVFADGRAIIKGTTDIGVARSVYARYVG